MNIMEYAGTQASPFHRGEQAIQQSLGVREQMEAFGRRVIRDYLPQQHRDFYRQLPYLLLGSLDGEGRPWASIMCGPPGFIESQDEHSLTLSGFPLPGDPLEFNLTGGSPIGVLGIELASRRRNRLSARVRRSSPDGFELDVVQSFGNCPQYIQSREFERLAEHKPGPVTQASKLTSELVSMIQASDTFFVASASGMASDSSGAPAQGVDVSHRGGQPGFVRVDGQGQLWIPDYPGNNHFNTLGNFLEYPRAGLLFPDFVTGDLLSLTGTVSIVWDSEENRYFDGAERFWCFKPERCLLLEHALPIRSNAVEPSANTGLTGTWELADRKRQLETMRDTWVTATVERVVDEGGDIRSFYLAPELPVKPDFRPGQFLPVRASIRGEVLQRTYTVSSAPTDEHYRISVKRDGAFSKFLHGEIGVGDRLEVKAPAGEFVLSEDELRPALLVGAGVGITPMLSMARHLLSELLRWRSMRPVSLLVVARAEQDRAFADELAQLERDSAGQLKVYWCLTQPGDDALPGPDVQFLGRPNKAVFSQLLSGQGDEIYLCGPTPFMQGSYSQLRELGVPDRDILAEAFGPAGLQREGDAALEDEVAASALVSFVDSKGETILEQGWEKADGSLLEFAEAHGLTPEFSCRSGQCGSCRATRMEGEIVHAPGASATDDNEILLCSARPRKDQQETDNRVRIRIPA